MKIVSFGSLNIDSIYYMPHFVQPGETLEANSLEVYPGGKGLNQSIALANAGALVYHAGLIGEDGAMLLDALNDKNVHTDLVKQVAGPSGRAMIQVDKTGENAIIFYGGANKQVDDSYIEQVFAACHKGDILLVQNEISNLTAIINRAHAKNMPIAWNPSPINQAIYDIDLDKITYLLINETEGKALSNETAPKDMIQSLSYQYPHMEIILTMGNQGVMYHHKGLELYWPAYKVNAIDTTGAGDTFCGFFMEAILSGKDAKTALTIASAAAALTVTKKGASTAIPTKEEVLLFLGLPFSLPFLEKR